MKRESGGSHDPVPPNNDRYVAAPYEIARQFNPQPRYHRDPECGHLKKAIGMSQPILTTDTRFIECRHCTGGPTNSSTKESNETR